MPAGGSTVAKKRRRAWLSRALTTVSCAVSHGDVEKLQRVASCAEEYLLTQGGPGEEEAREALCRALAGGSR
jgi:hypothetical protein